MAALEELFRRVAGLGSREHTRKLNKFSRTRGDPDRRRRIRFERV